jgi:diketogulonate reductase-like aldo/keto reductase
MWRKKRRNVCDHKTCRKVKSYKEAIVSIDASLQKLGLDYIDLLIIHSPKPWAKFLESELYFEGNRETWRALEEAYKAGKLRSIGLSNFEQADIDNILASCSVKPMINQILTHISNTPKELIKFSQDNDILVEAYSPFGHGELLKNKEIKGIAEKYDVSVPQLAIRYCLELGLLPLPKTANPQHMKTNAEVDFAITKEDMEVLKNMKQIENYGEHSKFPVFGKI